MQATHQPDDRLPQAPSHRASDLVSVHLNMSITKEDAQKVLSSLVQAEAVVPQVSLEYNRFRKEPAEIKKQHFRQALVHALASKWKSPSSLKAFMNLIQLLERDGATIIAGLIDTVAFNMFISTFDSTMRTSGQQAFLHTFLNLADHPSLLYDANFNAPFLHPLLIALIAYSMGGPVRLTDVRGKHTEPISVNAQDNMLHIDNTPFREEWKVLVAWEKGMPSGPTGQNFVFLPGTHRGTRRVRGDRSGEVWSTENDSIFTTSSAIDGLFAFQMQVLSNKEPKIVEAAFPAKPISVVFPAGALAHQRYRTEAGNPRSCVIAAFHLSEDHPGQLNDAVGHTHVGLTS